MQTPDNDNISIRVVMINSDGYYMPLAESAIHDLQLEDSLVRWWSRGYIDIKNEHDFIEKASFAGGQVTDLLQLDKETFNKGKTDVPYVFRNDGTDVLFIEIVTPYTFKDSFHTFTSTYNVYAVEEIDLSGNSVNKIKRLLLRDDRYQRMLYTNTPWSTTSLKNLSETQMRQGADVTREIKTGEAIKACMRLGMGPETNFTSSWDTGQYEIMYTSPANYNCVDDLHYLLSSHVSHEDIGEGKPILYYDRPFGYWRLATLELLFYYAATYKPGDDTLPGEWLAGALQTEAFKMLSFPDAATPSKVGPTRVPQKGDGVYQNYNLGHRSNIKSLEYHEINSSDNLNNIITTPVHLYNTRDKKFHIKQQENSIDRIYEKITNIVGQTPNDSNLPRSISIDINALRKLNTNIKHKYSTSDGDSKSYLNSGINDAIYKSVMLSNAVSFTVPGHPSRGVGRFVTIESETADLDNFGSPFHDKVYGQYLTTSVVHRYNNSMYTNHVIGVKPYNYRPVHNDNEDVEAYDTFKEFTPETNPQETTLGDFFNQSAIDGFFTTPESNE